MKVIWSLQAKENLQNTSIYYIHENTIEIVVLWDTRREPESLIKELN